MATELLRRTVPRLPDLTALALVALTVLAGPAVLSRLPTEMIVGFHFGLDGQWSLSHGPRLVGLLLVPAHAVGLFVAAWITRYLATLKPGTTDRRLFDLLFNLWLAALCGAQLSLLWLNL